MCMSYIKYNANMTRNVAYYMTTVLCLVRATRKKKYLWFILPWVYQPSLERRGKELSVQKQVLMSQWDVGQHPLRIEGWIRQVRKTDGLSCGTRATPTCNNKYILRGVLKGKFLRLFSSASALRPPTWKKLLLTFPLSALRPPTWGQSYTDFYTLGQIYPKLINW